jgi:hypothetical protein
VRSARYQTAIVADAFYDETYSSEASLRPLEPVIMFEMPESNSIDATAKVAMLDIEIQNFYYTASGYSINTMNRRDIGTAFNSFT